MVSRVDVIILLALLLASPARAGYVTSSVYVAWGDETFYSTQAIGSVSATVTGAYGFVTNDTQWLYSAAPAAAIGPPNIAISFAIASFNHLCNHQLAGGSVSVTDTLHFAGVTNAGHVRLDMTHVRLRQNITIEPARSLELRVDGNPIEMITTLEQDGGNLYLHQMTATVQITLGQSFELGLSLSLDASVPENAGIGFHHESLVVTAQPLTPEGDPIEDSWECVSECGYLAPKMGPLLTVIRSESGPRIRWPSGTGTMYRVERYEASTEEWLPDGDDRIGNGGELEHVPTGDSPGSLWRVVESP